MVACRCRMGYRLILWAREALCEAYTGYSTVSLDERSWRGRIAAAVAEICDKDREE